MQDEEGGSKKREFYCFLSDLFCFLRTFCEILTAYISFTSENQKNIYGLGQMSRVSNRLQLILIEKIFCNCSIFYTKVNSRKINENFPSFFNIRYWPTFDWSCFVLFCLSFPLVPSQFGSQRSTNMLPFFVSSINSSLYVLDLPLKLYTNDARVVDNLKILKVGLRNQEAFLLCARKLGNDAYGRSVRLRNLKASILRATKLGSHAHLRSSSAHSDRDPRLESLLARIEDYGLLREKEIYLYCRHQVTDAFALTQWLDNCVNRIQCIWEEMDKFYIIMSDHKRQSSSLTTDELVEITDFNLENIVDFLSLRRQDFRIVILLEGMDVLGVQMTFLKNFLRFAEQTSAEHRQLEDLLIHFEAVAIDGALLFLMSPVKEFDEESYEKMQFANSVLLRKIMPFDSRVYQTYTQALSRSKLSRLLHGPTQDMNVDTIIVLKNFLDSLIAILWDVLRLDTCRLVSMKDQLQILYEGLRFSRTILKQRQKIRDQIGVLVCDAGVLICSLHQTHAEIDHGLQDVLETIKVIRAEVEEKVPQTSIFNFPRTNELGFVDSLLENLTELTNCYGEPIAKSLLQTIQEELVFLRSFMGETVEFRNEQEELQALWNRVLDVAYRVEFLIDRLAVGVISDSFSNFFDPIIEDIRNIKTDLLKSSYGDRKDMKVKKVIRTCSHQSSQNTPSITNEVVGFHDEVTSILDRLTRGSKQLRRVCISGMAGLGKTTLASKVYDDPSVMCHFHVRAWCPVSQVLNKQKVLVELLNQIDPGRYSEMTEQDIAEKLRHRLKGRRYLIFLDDVWTIEVWNSLEGSFPDDSIGSRIILTSRLRNVVPHAMLDEEPHSLRQLTTHESLELLQKKLFHGRGWPPALYKLGMEIAESCKGLPLTIVIVAGLLARIEQEDWEEILDGLSSGVVSSTEQCMNTLELSYKHLPDYLKPCFLYFGAFPKDQEVSVKRLIWLWIAEGFVQKATLKSIEDVATDYVMDLIGRSLVMVAEHRSIGGVKTCRIHDLLHDFCLEKAKEEHFFHLLQGYDELLAFNEPWNLRRLCIHSEPEHFKESKLFGCRARSLLFSSQETKWYKQSFIHISFVFQIFKLLRVLDLEQIHLGPVVPSEIGSMIQLKYLAIRGNMTVIPSSIGNLSNLETFVVHPEEMVSLPHTLWNLQKLKYLYIGRDGGIFPIESLDNPSILYELESFSGAVIFSHAGMGKQLRKFPNIRRLKCNLGRLLDGTEKFNDIVVPDFLSRLESLHMFGGALNDCCFEFGLPTNLRKLTLAQFKLPWRKISTIAKLPNLEVLKLLSESFSGETWDMEEGEFPKLRFLTLSGLNIVKWTATDDQFPYLQKLVLNECTDLVEIPCCLQDISTLETIEVSYCSRTVESLVKHIEEELVNMGNSSTKIRMRSFNSFVGEHATGNS